MNNRARFQLGSIFLFFFFFFFTRRDGHVSSKVFVIRGTIDSRHGARRSIWARLQNANRNERDGPWILPLDLATRHGICTIPFIWKSQNHAFVRSISDVRYPRRRQRVVIHKIDSENSLTDFAAATSAKCNDGPILITSELEEWGSSGQQM